MPNFADDMADAAVERSIVLARYEAGLRRDVGKILRDMEKDILAALPDVTSQVRRERLNKQLADVRKTIAAYYSEIDTLTAAQYRDLVGVESAWQANTVNSAVGVDIITALPTEAALAKIASDVLIQGAPSAVWWARQSDDAAFRFSNAVRMGMAQSESAGQIVRRVKTELGVGTRQAYSLVRTSVQTVAVAARDATMAANQDVIAGKASVATLDGRTTFVCAAYDGACYTVAPPHAPIRGTKLPYLAIPRHWGCRSVWSPLVKTFRELGIPIDDVPASTRASMDGQVPAGKTFSEFLAGKSAAWQDKYLGPGRARLYRDGKITMADLIDGTGRELTLAELP